MIIQQILKILIRKKKIKSNNEQSDVDVQDLAEEGKYLIFESSLMKLLNVCPKCGSAIV